MAQLHIVKLKSTAPGSNTIIRARRNKKTTQTKLALKKFDKAVRKTVLFKEMKK